MSPDDDGARGRASRAMDRYAQGDATAFGDLYDALSPHLCGFAMNLARQRAVAEDVVQQTFLQLHRARHRWVPGANLFPWAYAIAHHLFIDAARRARRERGARPEEAERPDPPSETPGADDQLDVRRRLSVQLERVERLPEKLRVAFQLVVLEGLPIAEAAEVLGISCGNVKVRVHRAREALREWPPGLPQVES
jgi:RNA polymerase sigma-70 factor (ECF subfamily)